MTNLSKKETSTPIYQRFGNLAQILAAVAALSSAFAASKSFNALLEARKQSQITQTRQAVQTYLTTYLDARKHISLEAFSARDAYFSVSGSDRAEINIVLELLIQVVDLMNDADDERAVEWTKYMDAFGAPFAQCDQNFAPFARNGETKAQIIRLSAKFREELKAKCKS